MFAQNVVPTQICRRYRNPHKHPDALVVANAGFNDLTHYREAFLGETHSWLMSESVGHEKYYFFLQMIMLLAHLRGLNRVLKYFFELLTKHLSTHCC